MPRRKKYQGTSDSSYHRYQREESEENWGCLVDLVFKPLFALGVILLIFGIFMEIIVFIFSPIFPGLDDWWDNTLDPPIVKEINPPSPGLEFNDEDIYIKKDGFRYNEFGEFGLKLDIGIYNGIVYIVEQNIPRKAIGKNNPERADDKNIIYFFSNGKSGPENDKWVTLDMDREINSISVDSEGNLFATYEGGSLDKYPAIRMNDMGGYYRPLKGSPYEKSHVLDTEWTKGLSNNPKYTRGIEIDSEDNIYIVETQNNIVLKLNSYGNIIHTFADGNNVSLSPKGIAIDSNDNVYIADKGNDRVSIYNSAGDYINSIIGGLKPEILTIGINDNLYIFGHESGKVQGAKSYIEKWDKNGNFVEKGEIHFVPKEIESDNSGKIYFLSVWGVHILDE